MATFKLILYTTMGHKVPAEVEANQAPIVCESKNARYFAVSLVEGNIRMDGDRHIYLEIPVQKLAIDVGAL